MGIKSVIVGTAGHIDHGKSSIVKALTGTDPDRLKEEKSKGITIDLGFASFKKDDLIISFIDVPGHEALVKNMIAGATNFNICVLVIDAKEGIKAQTIEHCNIIDYLQIENLIVALNKVDLIDENILEKRLNEIKIFIEQYNFKNIEIIKTSVKDEDSITKLKETIIKYARNYTDNKIDFPFLMHIDRVFSLKGFGTIVTGTTNFGIIKQGDQVFTFPKNLKIKVKSIQNHNEKATEAMPNMRTAINLSDIKKNELNRGFILHKGDYYSTNKFYAQITVFKNIDSNFKIKSNKKYLIFYGTDYFYAKIILLDKKELTPGNTSYAVIMADKNIMTYPTERMLIRSGSPQLTIAGLTSIFCDDISLKKQNLLSLLQYIVKNEIKEALAILTQEQGYYIFKNLHQLFHIPEKEIRDLIKKYDYILFSNIICSKPKIDELIKNIINIIQNNDSINLNDLDDFKNLPDSLKEFLFNRIKNKLSENEFTFTVYTISKNKITPFEKKALVALSLMEKDLSVTNPANLVEKLNISKNEAEKIIFYLQNREKIKKISDNIFIPSSVLNTIVDKSITLAKEKGYVDIKNIKSIIQAPRKTIIAILEYLDKTNLFEKRDNKRFLKNN
ncbi:selenocysteine-specific translation elongation factor [Deferribacter desulfuricans SSM1]|uniref:Selenocysteine-specific translation elongation factor n=1 Tax=Deferribacter desulfuricans (strain DSM 14783 / JCM 11476 / NBRC 101012 / SSM1) TaxID=639282 RepID=D3PB07_DEFDS|nr:selenocysteine-specific translation elongation factor [Deferribacter desulfuricans]BAI79780.1 selenocysteine-specific translation elongation factor [Deferribacter desulfuricans SSM1]